MSTPKLVNPSNLQQIHLKQKCKENMHTYFKNKVIIITGSNQGIGRELALQLGSYGAKIVINGRNKEKLDTVLKELGDLNIEAIALNGDISDQHFCNKLIDNTVSHFGQLDVLINNAGMSAKASLEEGSLDIFKKVIDINLLGTVYASKFAIPHLKKSKGSLLFISSLAGIHGLPFFTSYSTSKMALTALSDSLRIELYGQNIHIGTAYVGFTETADEKTFYNKNGELEVLKKRENVKATPLPVTADKIIRQIKNRKKSNYHGTMGKINHILNRISPGFVEFFLKKSLHKFK